MNDGDVLHERTVIDESPVLDGLASIRRRSVLCVDDDAKARAVLRHALPGHRIVFAGSAFDALKALHHDLFDAYVLSYWLRDWTGAQMCRTIRGSDEHGPIFFLSAADRDIDRRRALRAGASVYLNKPVAEGLLRQRMETALTLADVDSLAAKPYAEDELERQVERCAVKLLDLPHPGQVSAASIERAVRAPVHKVFAARRGTRANFERWWPQMLSAAIANRAVLRGGRSTGWPAGSPAGAGRRIDSSR